MSTLRGPFKLPPFLIAFPVLLFACEAARACSCFGTATPRHSFERAEAVFVGTVTSVEQVNPRKDEEGRVVSEGQLARVRVEQAFKNMRRTEVVFRAANSSCDAVYEAGQRWLFYAFYDRRERAWGIRPCDRSTLAENAAADLLYLRGLPGSARGTWLSVTLEHFEDEPGGGITRVANLSGLKVTLVGGGQTREVYTNGDGVAVASGLPPGTYTVVPDVPKGLKVRFSIPLADAGARTDGPSLKVELAEKGCMSVSFLFSADTSVGGRLLGADGRPLPNVCLGVMPADKEAAANWKLGCTDEQGRYEVASIPPGRYVVVVNDGGKVSSVAPFRTAYYPGVFERERAGVLTIMEGANLRDFDIYIPAQEPTRTVRGVLLHSDGRPAAGEYVEFAADSVPEGYDGEARAKTDAAGRFSLTVLRSLKGSVRGSMNTYAGEYVNCPQLEKIIAESGGRLPEVSTAPVRLEGDADVQDVTLTFPFPLCAKAARE